MYVEYFLYIGILSLLSASAASLIPYPKLNTASYTLSASGALCMAGAGITGILQHADFNYKLGESKVVEFSFSADALSMFFLTLISILLFAVSVYSIGYTRHLKRAGLLGFLFNIFAVGMYGVVLSSNVITFLIFWETMSISSYFLVTHDRTIESERAGLQYAVMTHAGTAFIIALFLLLYKYTGYIDFASMAESAHTIPQGIKNLIFAFSLIGFGTKAGMVPLHIWLPKAHPAAPSNISALMSGVMIKTGIYGLIRMVIEVLGAGPSWWGTVVIVMGASSSVLGMLYALMERDIKRLLAYCSVENIGIILLGIGASMAFKSSGMLSLSSLALTAALFHTLNHSIFKGLLFLGAGSVVHTTGTKDMDKLGGLIKIMPYTAFFFLIGSVSICALPPFNGFVSEWLTYQALLAGFKSPAFASKIIYPLGGAALALTGALAAAGFVKAFGITFLGTPRSNWPETHNEPLSMTMPMAFLSILCLALGLMPSYASILISPSVLKLSGAQVQFAGSGPLAVVHSASSVSPIGLFISAAAASAGALIVILIYGGRRKAVFSDSWDCGMPSLTERMQYTATAFTKPVKLIFKRIYIPTRDLRVTYLIKPFFVKTIEYGSEITPFAERYIYAPLTDWINRIATKARFLQSGSLHLYLAYMLITLMVLLVFWS